MGLISMIIHVSAAVAFVGPQLLMFYAVTPASRQSPRHDWRNWMILKLKPRLTRSRKRVATETTPRWFRSENVPSTLFCSSVRSCSPASSR